MTPFETANTSENRSLYRLIYASRANPLVELADIMETAVQRNPTAGITGGLAFLDGVFLQYLEGIQDAVERLFASILADHRHRDVKVLERRQVPRRMFSDWSMAQLEWTDQTRQIFHSFSPGIGLNLYEVDPTTAAPMFRAWAVTESWQSLPD